MNGGVCSLHFNSLKFKLSCAWVFILISLLIKFNSNIYEINTEIIFEDFVSSSTSKIIYEGNNNGFIISRIYNGI